jgi:antitoxin VapB
MGNDGKHDTYVTVGRLLNTNSMLVYTHDIYPSVGASVAEQRTAKLFQNGRSQAVRLPSEFRFTGDRVRIRRVADGVLLQPVLQGADEWFAKLDEPNAEPFPIERQQPTAPKRKIFR